MNNISRAGPMAGAAAPARAGLRKQPNIVLDSDVHARLYLLAEMAVRTNPEVSLKLLSELDRANLVFPESLPADVVTIGRRVTYTDESTNVTRTIDLVWPRDADVGRMLVSVITPVGAALVGLRVGQRILWSLPSGETVSLRVDGVEPAAVA